MTPRELNKKFKLNSDKLALFCLEYVKDLNGTQAMIRAGYAPKTASICAAKKLALSKVQDCISLLQKQSIKRIEYTADDLKRSLIAVEEMDVIDILEDDGNVKPIKEWPVVWRRNISAFDVTSLLGADSQEAVTSIISKIKWPDKTKNRELLGRHIDIQAWREQLKVEESSVSARIERAKERIAKKKAKVKK